MRLLYYRFPVNPFADDASLLDPSNILAMALWVFCTRRNCATLCLPIASYVVHNKKINEEEGASVTLTTKRLSFVIQTPTFRRWSNTVAEYIVVYVQTLNVQR